MVLSLQNPVFYISSTSQVGLAMFPVFSGHTRTVKYCARVLKMEQRNRVDKVSDITPLTV